MLPARRVPGLTAWLPLAAALAGACGACPNGDARVEGDRCECTNGSGEWVTVDDDECGLDDPGDAGCDGGGCGAEPADGGCEGPDCVDGGSCRPASEAPETAFCPDRRDVTRAPTDPGATDATAFDLGVLAPGAPRAVCASVDGCDDPEDWLRFTLAEHAEVSLTATDLAVEGAGVAGAVDVRVVGPTADGAEVALLERTLRLDDSDRLWLPKGRPIDVRVSLGAQHRVTWVLGLAAIDGAASPEVDPPARGADMPRLAPGEAVSDHVGLLDPVDGFLFTLDADAELTLQMTALLGPCVGVDVHLDRNVNALVDASDEPIGALSSDGCIDGAARGPVALAAGQYVVRVTSDAPEGNLYTLALR